MVKTVRHSFLNPKVTPLNVLFCPTDDLKLVLSAVTGDKEKFHLYINDCNRAVTIR